LDQLKEPEFLAVLTVRVDIEAKPPKLGPFIEAINAALSDRRPQVITLGVWAKNSS
jgi:hypothetical protein